VLKKNKMAAKMTLTTNFHTRRADCPLVSDFPIYYLLSGGCRQKSPVPSGAFLRPRRHSTEQSQHTQLASHVPEDGAARYWEQFAQSVGLARAQAKKRILALAQSLPVIARKLQSDPERDFAGSAVVERIITLIGQRSALTTRRLTAPAA
jgi:hypothetical protein